MHAGAPRSCSSACCRRCFAAWVQGLATVARWRCRAHAAAGASPVTEEILSGSRKLELIISDVDGTLVNSKQQLTPGVRAAVAAAADAGVPLVVATGGCCSVWLPWHRAASPCQSIYHACCFHHSVSRLQLNLAGHRLQTQCKTGYITGFRARDHLPNQGFQN